MQLFLRVLRQNQVATIWIALFAVMPIVSSSLATWGVYTYEKELLASSWRAWMFFYVVASVGMGLALIPTTLVAIIGGYLLGLYALPPMVIAYLIAVMIGYFLAKKVDGGRFLQSLLKEALVQPYVLNIQRQPIKTVFYAKLSPILPFGISNLLLAFLGVLPRSLLIGSLLGMLPRTALATFAGWQLKAIGERLVNAGQSSTDWWVVLMLILLSIWGLSSIFRVKK